MKLSKSVYRSMSESLKGDVLRIKPYVSRIKEPDNPISRLGLQRSYSNLHLSKSAKTPASPVVSYQHDITNKMPKLVEKYNSNFSRMTLSQEGNVSMPQIINQKLHFRASVSSFLDQRKKVVRRQSAIGQPMRT